MVATVSKITSSKASTKYFAKDGYYLDGSEQFESTMHFGGKGAEQLGLIDEKVTDELFARLADGYITLEDGRVIDLGVKRGGQRVHAPGTDITLSAPKSLSLAATIGGDERLLQVQQKAADATAQYIEANVLESRAFNRETKQMERVGDQKGIWLACHHDTSRALDPQIHTHLVFFNACLGEDGKWRTMQNRSVYENQMLVGAVYHNYLAQFAMEVGYGIEKTGKNGMFELTHANGERLYSREQIEDFSKRWVEMREAMKERGLDVGDAAMREKMILLTRAAKTEPDREQLLEVWRKEAAEYGIEAGVLARDVDAKEVKVERPSPEFSAIEAVNWAARHLEERESVFAQHDIMREAIALEPGVHTPNEIERGIDELKEKGRLVEARIGEGWLTTDKLIEIERESVGIMQSRQGKAKALMRESKVEKHLEGTGLTDGQQDAVRLIYGSKDRIIGIQGDAGSGKTTAMEMVREIGEDKSLNIIALAPTSSATATLGETGLEAKTLQSFLMKYSGITEGRITDSYARQFGKDVKDSMIIVDESSFISSREMRDFLQITEVLRPARVVLVGDSKQLASVGAGEAFKQLQNAGMETALMEENKRQEKNPELLAAVQHMKEGEPAAAIEKIAESFLERDKGNLTRTAFEKWQELSPEAKDKTAFMAPTRAEIADINAMIIDQQSRDGILHGEAITISQMQPQYMTQAEKEVAENYREGQYLAFSRPVVSCGIEAGDVLPVLGNANGFVEIGKGDDSVKIIPTGGIANRFEVYEPAEMQLRAGMEIRWTKNDKAEGLMNGHRAEITGIEDGRIALRQENGREIDLSVKDTALQFTDYAWVNTVHGEQGRTSNHVIAIMHSDHPHLTNQRTMYVEATRARESVTIITDEVERLKETLEINTGERTTALDAIGEQLAPEPAVESDSGKSLVEAEIAYEPPAPEYDLFPTEDPDAMLAEQEYELEGGEHEYEKEYEYEDEPAPEREQDREPEVKKEKAKELDYDLGM